MQGGNKIGKKMGRPTNDPKVIRLGIRLTPDEAEALQYCSDKLNIPRTSVISKGIELVKAEIQHSKE